jgi:long-chain acyl-CoA synthetase
VRMLKLTPEERARHDVSSLRVAIHAAAPCPVDVKEQMIEWWGPIIEEYYAGSEGNGFCMINSETWLAHRGSVGRPVAGAVHVVDDDGNECAVGEIGTIYFESAGAFEYHNDPAKTASAHNSRGWSTLGDVGHVDAEGFVYLSDRRSHLIISGGVNIYPQEVENVLTLHPKVLDVAVIGVPDAEMGEAVKAVVQPADMHDAGPELAAELIAYCRERLAHFKCPRSVDFDPALPRLPSGKLFKRRLIDQYRGTAK